MEFRVLGPVRATNGDGEVTLGGPRQRRLLAVLLLGEGRVVSIDRIVEAVWGEEQPPANAARTALSYVSRLRTALGDGYVSTRDEGYLLDRRDATVDAERFTALVRAAGDAPPGRALPLLDEAVALWGGRAFGDLADENWCRPAATRLEELRLVALEARAQARLDLGAHAEAVPELEQLVVEHPLRDRFRAQLMLALFRSGRQADALRSFQVHRRVLADETGLDPSRELVELERRIALADPSLAFVTAGRTKRGYVLADVIGEGAFGTVYRAVQPSVGREVAVKVVRPELADDPDYVRRFEGEARLVARLEHPHIVPLYDFWREPGAAYLVFRYVRGGSVEAAAHTAGRWPLARVSRLVEEIGAALAAAHDAGVVHRDVKPANVLFDEAGNAYLADFGIATDALEASTADGLRSAGSPLYASPEQVRDGVATPRSDQYALAVMAWELLAGAPPFDGDRVTTLLRAKLENTVPSLRDRRPDVPTEIDGVLRRAAAVHPDDRFASMTDLVLAWRDAAARPLAEAITTGSLDAASGLATSTLGTVALAVANPYKGLRAFDEADARDFYGRETAVERLATLVGEQRFTVVVGASGSGKSSLVRAGLVPRLRAAGRLVAIALPGARPAEQIAEALVQIAVDRPANLEHALVDRVRVGPALRALLPDGTDEVVLVLDQFEELWTLAAPAERDALLDALVAATAGPRGPLRVIATVRADFYDRPLSHPAIGGLVETGSFSLAPLAPADLERAMSAPAARVGVRLEAGLAAELLTDLSARPAGLPLLQYALTELFDRRDGATMTVAAYASMGGLAGALTTRAEALYDAMPEADRAGTRRLFARLVAPGDGAEDTRRRARRSELAGIAPAALDAYGTARLLTFDVDPIDREPTVEVAHEALIRHWPRLRAWLDEDREGLRLHRHLADAAAAWHSRGRDAGELYRGARLAAADEWAERREDELAPVERAFLHDARRRARRSRRVAEAAVAALGVLVVAALVAAGLAVAQRRRADRSAATARAARESSDLRRLAFQAQTLAPQQPQLGLLLALEAHRRTPGTDSDGALLVALDSLRVIDRYVTLGERRTVSGEVSGDRRLVALQDGVEVVLLDGTTLQPNGVRIPLEGIGTVKLSPDGTEMATGTSSGVVRRWDTTTGREVAPAVTVPAGRDVGFGASVAYLRGGRLVVADGTTLLVFERGAATASQRIDVAAVNLIGLRNSDSGRYLVFNADFQLPTGKDFIYDDDTGALRPMPPGQGADGIDEVRRRIIGGTGVLGGVVVTDLDTLALVARRDGVTNDSTFHWTFLPDGSAVAATIGSSGFVRVGPDLAPLPTLAGLTGLPLVTAEGRIVAAVGNGFGVVDETGRGPLARTLDVSGPASASGDDRWVGVVTTDGVVLVDRTGQAPRRGPFPLAPGAPAFGAPGVSRDGALVAYVSGGPATMRVIDTASGATLWERPVATSTVVAPAFSPDDGRIAVRTFAGVDVLAARTGELVSRASAGEPSSVPFRVVWDRAGSRVAAYSGDGSPTIVTDAGSGRVLSTVMVGATRAAWAPDGDRLVAVAFGGGDLALVDPVTGAAQRTFPGLAPFGDLAFSGSGRRTVHLTRDAHVQMVDLEAGTVVGHPVATEVTPGGILQGAFSADGTTVFVSQIGFPVIEYDMDPASWATKACDAVGRNLTRAEWAQYLGTLGEYRATCEQYPPGA